MVSSTHRPHFTPGKDPVPIVQEAGWVSRPVWTGGKSRPHQDSIPDIPLIFRDLLHVANLRHGADGFTSPPKEGVLRIFSP